jgi:hypothetical protein
LFWDWPLHFPEQNPSRFLRGLPNTIRKDCAQQTAGDFLSEMRWEAQRDSAFGFQRREWLRERRVHKIIRRILERRRQLLRRRLHLPLSPSVEAPHCVLNPYKITLNTYTRTNAAGDFIIPAFLRVLCLGNYNLEVCNLRLRPAVHFQYAQRNSTPPVVYPAPTVTISTRSPLCNRPC